MHVWLPPGAASNPSSTPAGDAEDAYGCVVLKRSARVRATLCPKHNLRRSCSMGVGRQKGEMEGQEKPKGKRPERRTKRCSRKTKNKARRGSPRRRQMDRRLAHICNLSEDESPLQMSRPASMCYRKRIGVRASLKDDSTPWLKLTKNRAPFRRYQMESEESGDD